MRTHTTHKWLPPEPDPHPPRKVRPMGAHPWDPGGQPAPRQTSLHCIEGACPLKEAEPSSPIAPRGAPTWLQEGNQAPEQMAGPLAHEPRGGGHLDPSRRAARATTTQAHAPARRWGGTWAQSIKISRSLASLLGGRAFPPQGPWHVPAPWKGAELRGPLAPFPSPPPLNNNSASKLLDQEGALQAEVRTDTPHKWLPPEPGLHSPREGRPIGTHPWDPGGQPVSRQTSLHCTEGACLLKGGLDR